MYEHILIATDGSEIAHKAVMQGIALAKALGAKVTGVTVTEPWAAMGVGEAAVYVHIPMEEYDKGAAANAAQILAVVDKAAKSQGVPCKTLHAKDQFPADGILAAAAAEKCDLIVMASHGRRGLSRLLLGSQTNQVVTRSTRPVLVCR